MAPAHERAPLCRLQRSPALQATSFPPRRDQPAKRTDPRRAEIRYINPKGFFVEVPDKCKQGANPDIERMCNPMHGTFNHHGFAKNNLCKIARIPQVSNSGQIFPAATTIMK
jgi:hypothetical protein